MKDVLVALAKKLQRKQIQAPKVHGLALQLPFPQVSESMGNHDSKIVDAGSVN